MKLGFLKREIGDPQTLQYIEEMRREERICKNCRGGEVEDVGHLMMRCTYVEEEREKLEELMNERVIG